MNISSGQPLKRVLKKTEAHGLLTRRAFAMIKVEVPAFQDMLRAEEVKLGVPNKGILAEYTALSKKERHH